MFHRIFGSIFCPTLHGVFTHIYIDLMHAIRHRSNVLASVLECLISTHRALRSPKFFFFYKGPCKWPPFITPRDILHSISNITLNMKAAYFSIFVLLAVVSAAVVPNDSVHDQPVLPIAYADWNARLTSLMTFSLETMGYALIGHSICSLNRSL